MDEPSTLLTLACSPDLVQRTRDEAGRLLARHGSVARAIRATSDFDSALIEQLRQIFQPLTDGEVVAIHLRGYASLSLPDVATPSHWRARDPELSAHADLAVVFVASALGDILSWPSLQSGRVLNDVLPIRGHEDQQTGHGSEADLLLHVEDAFRDDRCDFLVLLSLRNPGKVATHVAALERSSLDDATRRTLSGFRFTIAADPEHIAHDPDGRFTVPSIAPITDRVARYHSLRVDFPFTRAMDDEADVALSRLADLLGRRQRSAHLSEGDVLVVDNKVAAHGRPGFKATNDGQDRWLRKALVLRREREPEKDAIL